MIFGVGIPVTPEIGAAVHAGLAALIGAIAPWDIGSAYLNFTEEPVDSAKFYTAEAYARLRRVKAEVDPDGVFRGNHVIDAA
jgi:FAD/FMN-containing dehydrogenase